VPKVVVTLADVLFSAPASGLMVEPEERIAIENSRCDGSPAKSERLLRHTAGLPPKNL